MYVRQNDSSAKKWTIYEVRVYIRPLFRWVEIGSGVRRPIEKLVYVGWVYTGVFDFALFGYLERVYSISLILKVVCFEFTSLYELNFPYDIWVYTSAFE